MAECDNGSSHGTWEVLGDLETLPQNILKRGVGKTALKYEI